MLSAGSVVTMFWKLQSIDTVLSAQPLVEVYEASIRRPNHLAPVALLIVHQIVFVRNATKCCQVFTITMFGKEHEHLVCTGSTQIIGYKVIRMQIPRSDSATGDPLLIGNEWIIDPVDITCYMDYQIPRFFG